MKDMEAKADILNAELAEVSREKLQYPYQDIYLEDLWRLIYLGFMDDCWIYKSP